ncbi:hypothetical protein GCM10027346_42800 [Hymenobacter seoulensis]
MKKLFYVLGFLLLCSTCPVLAQTEPDIVVVHINTAARKVAITRGEGKTEITEFRTRFGSDKYLSDVNEAYYTTIKKLLGEGYVLQERLDSVPTASTLLFVRAPKP